MEKSSKKRSSPTTQPIQTVITPPQASAQTPTPPQSPPPPIETASKETDDIVEPNVVVDDDTGNEPEYDGEQPKRKKRAVAVTKTFKEFMKDFASFVNVGKKVNELTELTKTLKSGVKSFDDIVSNLPVKSTTSGALTLGEATVGSVRRLAREADLSGLAKLSKSSVQVLESDKRAFSKLVDVTPEKTLKELSDASSASKALHPSLNVNVGNLDKLSATAKSDLKKVESNLTKYFKEGTKIALVVGAVYVGVDWISKATEARKGCYMLTTINNKTTSCKVAAYSCANPSNGSMCDSVPPYYNTTLVLMAISGLPDTDQTKIDLAAKLSMEPKAIAGSLKSIVDTKFAIVNTFVKELKTRPTLSVCGLKSPQIENGVVPDCRMCSSSADPTSTAFIDPTQFGDNITFQCVTNPSIIDTITDAATSTAKDLWEGVSKTINFPIKNIAIYAVLIVVVLMIVWLVSKFLVKPNTGYVRVA